MKLPKTSLDRILSGVARAELGDSRRWRRLNRTMSKMAKRPSWSFPHAMGSDADLEGAYRLASNEKVDFQEVLDAFANATVERAKSKRAVFAIHDTTDASFAHADPNEVGHLPSGKAGFFIHFALVVEADEWRRPLGVVHTEILSRRQRSKRGRKNKASGKVTAQWKDRESLRWARGVQVAQDALCGSTQVIHVADREGDSYALLASMMEQNASFVVRAHHDRKVGDPTAVDLPWTTLKEHVRSVEEVLERDVTLSARKSTAALRGGKTHAARRARMARLSFAASSIVLRRPTYLKDPVPPTLTLNVVHVREENPPPDETPVEWLLFTTLPVNSKEQVAYIVDCYRTRWTVEEFNKALKTGCAYETREFQTLHALLVVLAMTLPIACELLWLRSRARAEQPVSASTVMTAQQVKILRQMGSRPLPRSPTARDALWALAGLGGHHRRNGEPGWLVLYRGMQTLMLYEEAYEVAYNAGFVAGKTARTA